ncbi:MAG: hypothetical protein JW818_09640, partial [Pirellulales bacterium]|nr:hypothetical protein [Pirellulales bacterium]
MFRVLRVAILVLFLSAFCRLSAAEPPNVAAPKQSVQYFAHQAVEDPYGVIAPWHQGLNGQCDFRVRVAAETLKRYPWADRPTAVTPGPCYVFSGHWNISPQGKITSTFKLKDWHNGDLGQRSAYILGGLNQYYRYSGDPAAIAHLTHQADLLLD